MTRFQALAFVVSLFLAGCDSHPSLAGVEDDELAVGETITVQLYEDRRGFEVESFSCTHDGDGVTSSDPSILEVRATGRAVIKVYGGEPEAMNFELTGRAAGQVAITSTCNGASSSADFYVR